MIRRPPRSTRTDTLFPYTALFRSFAVEQRGERALEGGIGGDRVGEELPCGLRRIARPAGRQHRARQRLEQQILPRPVDIGSALAIARHGNIDQPRVDRRQRSEERRVGKEWVRTGRSWGSPYL